MNYFCVFRVRQMFLKEKGYSPNSLQRQPDCQIAAEVVKTAFGYNPDYEVRVKSIQCI